MESHNRRGSSASRYLAAFIAPAVVAAVLQVTWPFFQETPVSLYLLAVVFCSWYGGLGPGLSSIVISFLLTDFFFIEPYFHLWLPSRNYLVRLIVFATVAPFIAVMSELTHRARRRAEANLEVAERAQEALAQAAAIVESSDDAIISKTLDGIITSWNKGAARLYGYSAEEVMGQPVSILIPPEVADALPEILNKVRHGELIDHYETTRVKKDGTQIYVSLSVSPIKYAGGAIIGAAAIARDITARKQAEEALRESEKKFRAIADQSFQGILLAEEGTATFANPAFCEIIGYPLEEALALTPAQRFALIHPDNSPRVLDRKRRFELGEPIEEVEEIRITRKNGEMRWVLSSNKAFTLQGKSARLAILTDITERKQAEEQLQATTKQLRALSVRIQTAKEAEGTRIAREIHDELGAALTCLRWDLESFDKAISQLGDESQQHLLRERINAMVLLTETTVGVVRRISSELRPSILDDLGLVEAIDWQARQFQDRTGITCRCDCSPLNLDLGRDRSTAVFRILQEALTNILRHAGATMINIKLNAEGGELILTISDNGRGITEDEKSKPQALGLLGMQERVHLLGGTVNIEGIDRKGTVVTVRVPISDQTGQTIRERSSDIR